jgi:hypothetical protein
MIKFNYYPARIDSTYPIGECDLLQFINAIRNPKPETIELFKQIKEAEENNDMTLKQSLKSKLYYVTPCVYINNKPRKYINIESFTGYLMIDFDHLETDYATEFKEALFNEYKYIIATWLSASKHGVRAIISIPVCISTDEFKERFAAIQNIFDAYRGFDKAPKNCVLPLFLSYDENILYRDNYTTFIEKYKEPERQKTESFIITDKTNSIEKIIYNYLQRITDSGHPVLRAASYLLGGYVGAGYIDHGTANGLVERLIDSHGYLCKKSPIYKKTAKEMIIKGISNPIYLSDGKI